MSKQSQYTYDFPRPGVATDIVLFADVDEEPHILLIRRRNEPFRGDWALPGGFLDEGETLRACAERELQEETGVSGVCLTQFHCYGDPGRDPRGWSLSIAFWGEAKGDPPPIEAADDADEAAWYPLNALPPVAFDHDEIIARANLLRTQ